MSRIGKQILQIPAGVTTSISEDGVFSVTGPKGSLERRFNSVIEIKIDDKEISFVPKKNDIKTKALWGTYSSHVSNMVQGVTEGFEKKLSVQGVGYRSEVKGSELVLSVGFSHPVAVKIPEGLTVTAEKNLISVSGVDKEMVGLFAGKVRAIKKPEPYKGKGIRYEGEVVKMKQGKKSA